MTPDGPLVVGIGYPAEWDRADPSAHADGMAALTALDPRIVVTDARYAEGTELTDADRAAFEPVEVLLTMHVPPDIVAIAPRLRWVQGIGAGIGQLVEAGLIDAGVRVTSAAGVNAASVAEFAVTRVLAHYKRLRELDEAQVAHEWRALHGRELAGSTAVVIGLGAIGTRVASMLSAFGVRIVAVRRDTNAKAPDEVDTVVGADRLHEVLGDADVVVAAAAATPDTAGLMDAAAFTAMRAGAFFCNVGRGSLVDEDALVDALDAGRLGGAALDVTRIEPLPADSRLWDAPRLYLSPHVASTADGHFAKVYRLFRDNLARYLAGESLHNEVQLGRGY